MDRLSSHPRGLGTLVSVPSGEKLSPVRPVPVPHYSLGLLSLEMHVGLRTPYCLVYLAQSLPSCQSRSLCLVTPQPQSIPHPAHHHLGFIPKPSQLQAGPEFWGVSSHRNTCSHLLPRLLQILRWGCYGFHEMSRMPFQSPGEAMPLPVNGGCGRYQPGWGTRFTPHHKNSQPFSCSLHYRPTPR